ncbi:YbaB/EbfC family DNA-binding protein [Amycolatopsis balhimycina DSM 5908]|uniref:YbaB/EbfC family DNA-binding protein n=1 Tax=Amycolatopsis balhimycina DSM 5908 TaxID=1081091 RepID=A0A428W1S2_AMYBA|nr:YbaB/EbfC family nucleoid-associated protein [Amycolatopsis balhimycina]RSM37040.1 YbaB/EbfC family DNA-binding protein [Amycolatopsis balhimycina DSM 5908]
MSNPEQLFSSFEAKMAEAQQKADRMRAEMETVSVAERSKDGQIGVKVNHLGNLVGLEIGQAAREKPDLADEILRTVQVAQSRLAAAVESGVPSIAGTGTMAELVGQLHREYPEPEPEGFVEGGYETRVDDAARFIVEEEPPKPAAPPRPARPPADGGTDDDYFGDGGYLR